MALNHLYVYNSPALTAITDAAVCVPSIVNDMNMMAAPQKRLLVETVHYTEECKTSFKPLK